MSSRILIAAGQPVLRDGIRTLLEQGGFCVVGVAPDLDDAIEMARRWHPDVTVLEVSKPGLNAVEIARRIQGGWPQTRVLLLAARDGFPGDGDAAGSIAGLVGGNDGPEDLIRAVAEVSLRMLQPDSHWHPAAPPRQELSRRQREVLAMIAGAKSTREIAAHFGVSPKTVESHRSSIMERLDIHDVATLVRFAMRHGMAGPQAEDPGAPPAEAGWNSRAGALAGPARAAFGAGPNSAAARAGGNVST